MKILIVLIALLSVACSDDESKKDNLRLGQSVFDKNCAICHGTAGSGLVKQWWERQEDGGFPPPPLNGTAHTWHHSPQVLLRTIDEGGVRLGGKMPGFKGKLSKNEKQALLDYIYSLWPNDIKQRYDQRFK